MIIYVTDSNVLRRNKRKGNENEIKTVDNGPLVFLTTELLDNLSQESRLDFYIHDIQTIHDLGNIFENLHKHLI